MVDVDCQRDDAFESTRPTRARLPPSTVVALQPRLCVIHKKQQAHLAPRTVIESVGKALPWPAALPRRRRARRLRRARALEPRRQAGVKLARMRPTWWRVGAGSVRPNVEGVPRALSNRIFAFLLSSAAAFPLPFLQPWPARSQSSRLLYSSWHLRCARMWLSKHTVGWYRICPVLSPQCGPPIAPARSSRWSASG